MSNRARGRAPRDPARSTPRRVIAVTACAVFVVGGSAGCFAEPSALPAMRDFLIAWQVGNYKAAARKTTGTDQSAVAAALGQVRGQLDAASLKMALGVPVQPGTDRSHGQAITKTGDAADAKFSVKVDLGENGQPWTYTGSMKLKRIDGKWKVQWDPSIIHPSLKPGQRLAVVTEVPARAPIQDSAAHPLLRKVNAAIVGVYPGQLRDPKKTVEQLANATKTAGGQKLDSERLLGRVRSAPPHAFLPLLTLQKPANNALILRLQQMGGFQVQNVQAPIAAQLAPELVGTLGPATADRLQQVGAPYQPGDTIGASGLQLLQQRRLAGIPTVRVVAQDPDGKVRQELRSWPGLEPQPVRTTIDRKLQPRAELALSGLKVPASMVVVRPSTGEVMAVANHLTQGRNLAMEGRYSPGYTFGIISAQALLNGGMSQNTPTECPATTTVGGQTFTNPGQARGKSTLQMSFAYSCATTLANLSSRLDAGALVAEADRLGLGKNWGLSVPAFSGSVPRPANEAQKAATMIGQGGIQVSPLAMAMVAGAVETGTWRPPYLLNDPRDPQQGVAAQPLNPVPTSDMKKLMRRSVFQGTAREANVRTGANVSGVVAVADQGGKPVSWFVGSRGDLAFAIAVEGRANTAKLAAGFITGTPAVPAVASG
ncbi:penicillin-binding transpeptidase domain-containing protein [Actinomadura viridis]|uniref:Cell division protein FtsI/penicillin-binding protein 2 n=1 Tax=Actinomadura viridis TaxID=58110 RepID=A0A931D969_9ACTN|nr:penicillin-binding transpeptidase domain-containing protein [Actinomadura viridis]MBG6086759.1 cell division protein FtsI/penicillin-binding protein 2 [Actinomadura viridis]